MKQRIMIMVSVIVISVSFAAEAGLIKTTATVSAKRATEQITVDGVLSEAVWSGSGYSSLIQRDPIEGADPTEKTEVFFAYDDAGIYIAGKCYHTGPDSIAGGFARRDKQVESDWFWFWIDPDNDNQTAFGFGVNPDGSIMDQKMYQDIYEENDWNGIWESAARRQGDKWTFEMFIPYTQLRFSKQDEYEFGINFKRYVIKNAEHDWFVMTPKNESGFVSRFGSLTGIKGISPPSRLFISPYVMGRSSYSPAARGGAFYERDRWGSNIGLDLKYGITGNLTLDLAVNPDFGQAEVDPAVLNLSAFETYYAEKREFFIEGADIFQFGSNPAGGVWGCYWSDPRVFYSRRIGRTPTGNVTHSGEVSRSENTTILGASKMSGKIGDWKVGAISAVTQKEYGLVDSAGTRFEDPIEPLANYTVLRGMKEFNDGDQGLGFIYTGVTRKLDEQHLSDINNSRAFVGGIDGWTFFGRERAWAFMGNFIYSSVQGSEARIAALQQASTHYYQRPDLTYTDFDSTRTAIFGYQGRFGIKKMRGNFTMQAALGFISPGFDVNDAGYIQSTNRINWHVVGQYRWLQPKSWYRQMYLSVMTSRNFDFDGNLQFQQVYSAFTIVLSNYWVLDSYVQVTPEGLSATATRGGPLMGYPGYTDARLMVRTDQRKALQLEASYNRNGIEDGSYTNQVSAGLTYRPSSSVRLNLSASRSEAMDKLQWVRNIADNTAPYGAHYVFSTIDYDVTALTMRIDWGITPRLSLQSYIQPFFAVGRYYGFKELAKAGTYDTTPYDYSGNPDFNMKSFKANVVLRWEYLPGSLLYLVWTQNRSNFANPGDFDFRRDMRSLFNEWSDNVLFVKFTYMFKG
ncbi:hypothetical protein JXO52_12830 [bacterium]|nr:hypothetical protein [bacterium]